MLTFPEVGIDLPAGAAGEIRVQCPSCSGERRKSREKCLAVNVEKGTWFCHHCGWTGGLGKDFEPLPNRPKVYRKPVYHCTPDQAADQPMIDWFKKRGISYATVLKNQITWGPSFGPTPAIRFPYHNTSGTVVNIKHRSLNKEFRQEKDAEKVLYRLDKVAQAEGDMLIITEGEVDALSFQEAGFNAVTSIPDGAPPPDAREYHTKFSFLEGAERILAKFPRIILATDADAPGKVAEQELARRIGVEKCWRVKYPEGCKDANDVLVKHGQTLLVNLVNDATPYPVEGLLSVQDLHQDVLALYDKGPDRGYFTGWKALDAFYRVRPGEMTVVTGIPGSGKSNWLDAMAVLMAQIHGWQFAVFSPENWPLERHIKTLLEKIVKKPFARDGQAIQRMTKGEATDSLRWLDQHFHFIAPQESLLSVDTVLEKARIAIFRHGCRGLIIDPWNELDHQFGFGQTETQYISAQLTKIRRFARLNACHIWLVAHPRNLTKDKVTGDYKPPTAYEISGGANWRNKADQVICVHRPDYQSDKTLIYVQKVRFRDTGKLGEAALIFDKDNGTYWGGGQ